MSQIGILNCSLTNNGEVTFGKDVTSCEFNTTQQDRLESFKIALSNIPTTKSQTGNILGA